MKLGKAPLCERAELLLEADKLVAPFMDLMDWSGRNRHQKPPLVCSFAYVCLFLAVQTTVKCQNSIHTFVLQGVPADHQALIVLARIDFWLFDGSLRFDVFAIDNAVLVRHVTLCRLCSLSRVW